MVATTQGDEDAAATLWPQLDQLGATDDWAALVAVLQRILASERGEQLLAGLDPIDAAIARETLRRLSNRK